MIFLGIITLQHINVSELEMQGVHSCRLPAPYWTTFLGLKKNSSEASFPFAFLKEMTQDNTINIQSWSKEISGLRAKIHCCLGQG